MKSLHRSKTRGFRPMERTALSLLLVTAMGPGACLAAPPTMTGAASAAKGDFAAPGAGVGYYSGYRGSAKAPNADADNAIAPPKSPNTRLAGIRC